MSNTVLKWLIIDVGGEAVLKYPFPVHEGSSKLEMIEAIITSNPVLRIVDNAEIGDIWDGQNFTPPVE